MTTPHTDTDELEELIANWIIIETKDLPYIKVAKMEAREKFRAAILAYANQHARKVERHYESLLAKTPRITLGPVKSGLGPYTCDSQHQDQLSRQDKKE